MKLTAQDLERFERSYIRADQVEAAGIFRVDNVEGAEIVGRMPRNGCDYSGLVFPYYLLGEPHVREFRLRRDHPDKERRADGTEKELQKYLGPPGRGNKLYFPPGMPVEWLGDTTVSITFVEGEKKALALFRYHQERGERRLVLGLAGVWGWRGTVGKTRNDDGQRQNVKGVIPDFDLIKWARRVVLVVFDANVATNDSVAEARRALCSELRRRGASAGTIDLPQIEGVNGIDDLLGIKGPDFVTQVLVTNVGSVTDSHCAWEEVSLFSERETDQFPIDALPDVLRNYVLELAMETQTPPELSAMLGLTVAGAAVARNVRVQVRVGWSEPLNLYTMTALTPGSRKSAVFERVVKPLEACEKELRGVAKDEIAKARTNLQILEKQLEDAIKLSAKRKGGMDAADLSVKVALAREELPVEPELLADDITPEHLKSVLAAQGGRIALLSAEGDIFEIIGGRYSGGVPNLDVFLKGHSGDTLRVGRQGRKEFVERPALSLGLTVQPDVIRGLADKPGFRDRGLCARILYAIPADRVGYRTTNAAPMKESTETVYEKKIAELAGIQAPPDGDGNPATLWLRFSVAARQEIERIERRIEPELIADTGSLSDIRDWASKLAGAVVRISGLLHLLEHGEKSKEIGPETVIRAATIGDFLISHAKRAHDLMGSDRRVSDAKYVAHWIESHVRETRSDRFTRRQAHRGMHSKFQTVEDLNVPFKVLEDHGYIRTLEADDRRGGHGGRPSQVFEINPLWDFEKPVTIVSKPPRARLLAPLSPHFGNSGTQNQRDEDSPEAADAANWQ